MASARRMCMRVLPWLIVLLTTGAWADTIYLTDGTSVDGKIQKTSDGWSVTQADGTVVRVPADKVASIEAGRSAESPDVAADRLASLRRVADNLTDIRDIIARYKKFIDQATDPTAKANATQDLQMWQERLDKGLVKLGEQWVTPQERDSLQQAAQAKALPAGDLIKNYRYKEADQILHEALAVDPQCATALYLQGVMYYRQDNLIQARKAFEAVNPLVPNHAPTLNDLAVIFWRQKTYIPSIGFYNQAMMATPLAKQIIDNVAEALNALPDANKNAPVVQQAVRLFTEQDTELQKQAAVQGMYRWGATWVDAKELAELKADQQRIQQQVDNLQQQYDALTGNINQIDAQIQQNQVQMDRLKAASIITDRNGNTINMPLPQVYYDLQSDNQRLATQKAGLVQQQTGLQNRAAQIQQGLPVPKFTGVQQIIGVDGVPVRDTSGNGPTTTPSAVDAPK